MVGAPKHLSDLVKIEAHLAVRCRACGLRRVFERDRLAKVLHLRQCNMAWSELSRAIPCRCGSIDQSLAPIPFCKQLVDPEMRPHDQRLVALAFQILMRANRLCSEPVKLTDDLRLALHVLRPWVRRHLLVSFSEVIGREDRRLRTRGIANVTQAIAADLVMMGRLAPELEPKAKAPR